MTQDSFKEWWNEPVEGTGYSKDTMRQHIADAMGYDSIDLKLALQDAYKAGWNECSNVMGCNDTGKDTT